MHFSNTNILQTSSDCVLKEFLTFSWDLWCKFVMQFILTKTTAAQNEVAPSYHGMHGLYFLAVFFVSTIYLFLLHCDTLCDSRLGALL